MQNCSSRVRRDASKNGDEIVEGGYWALPSADVPIYITYFLSNMFADPSFSVNSVRFF